MRRFSLILAGLVTLANCGAPLAEAQQLRLYGVVLGAEGGELAYVEDPGTGRVRGYRVGDSIGDSRVIAVEADRVILQRDGEAVQLRLGGAGQPAAQSATNPPQQDPARRREGASGAPGQASPAPGLCPPFCPPTAPGPAESGGPAPGPSPLPCPPFCPPPAPAPADAGQPCPPNCPPPLPVGPRPAAPPLPCPPFCPAQP